MTADPLTPSEEKVFRAFTNPGDARVERVWATLDQARARIAELERGLEHMSQSIIHSWKARVETAELDRDAAEQLKSSVIQRIVRERDEARTRIAELEHANDLADEVDIEAQLRAKVSDLDAVLSMTVARLGGTVEGALTNRINFLQRIDDLRAEIERLKAKPSSDEWVYLEQRAQRAEAEIERLKADLEKEMIECRQWAFKHGQLAERLRQLEQPRTELREQELRQAGLLHPQHVWKKE